MLTLSIGLMVVCVAVLAVMAARTLRRYPGFVKEHYQLQRAEPVTGQCARLRCTKPAAAGEQYCTPTHEMDDAYNDAGY